MQAKSSHITTKEGPTFEEFLNEQDAGGEFQAAAQTFGQPASCYRYDPNVVHIRTVAIDGTLQKVVSVTLRAHILFWSH